MTGLFKGELMKIASTRTVLAYAIAGIVLTVANVVVVGLASGDLHDVAEKQEVLAGLPIVLLLFGLVGTAGEYRHRTAAPAALVARPGRGRLLAARIGTYALAGLGVAILMVGVSLGLGLPLLGGQPGPALTTSEVSVVAVGCLGAAVLFAMMGAALGAMTRNQVAGVVGALILNFVMNPLIAMIDEGAAEYTPFGAASVLARMTHNTALTPSGAALVLLAWTVPLVGVAIAVERRRDLT
jgi:hypothetical protein